MKPDVQPAVHHCDRCGLISPVIQRTAWEFDYRCPCGKASGCLSWAHANAPPRFEPAKVQQQQELF